MNPSGCSEQPYFQQQLTRSPLKWAGGKNRVIQHIQAAIPRTYQIKRFIEPFVGGGSVFINGGFADCLIADTNQDLINLYRALKRAPKKFVSHSKALFVAENNRAEVYYELRERFNASSDPYERACLFLYLNRHGYNGLCRFNASGGYNVPFGRYKKPYFPENELITMASKLKKTTIKHCHFQTTFKHVKAGDLIYCDPPYLPASKTANFTHYDINGFTLQDHQQLVELATKAKAKGAVTLISNHATEEGEQLYQQADDTLVFNVQRAISQNGEQRTKVSELIAIYGIKNLTT